MNSTRTFLTLKKNILLTVALTGAGIAIWPFIEARWPKLKQEHITIPSNRPWKLTILHISDLHMWKGKKWVLRYLLKLADLNPDLVALTGDNFAEAAGLEDLKKALTPLLGKPGIFCYGSNDYYSGIPKLPIKYFFSKALPGEKSTPKKKRKPDLPTDKLTKWLENKGWLNLNNSTGEITLSTRDKAVLNLAFTGVDDPHINRDEKLKFPPNWLKSDLRIGLSHAPYSRMLNSFWAAGTQLVMSGHTHGGQVCLPGGRAMVNNTDLDLRYSSGLLRWEPPMQKNVKPRKRKGKVIPGETLSSIASRVFAKNLPDNIEVASSHADYRQTLKLLNQLEKALRLLRSPSTKSPFTWVNISRGLGTSKYTPFRLFCRPEVSLITVSGIKID